LATFFQGADPGSGERGGAGRFIFKFMVNFKDFFNIKNFTDNFKDILQMGGGGCAPLAPSGSAPVFRMMTFRLLHGPTLSKYCRSRSKPHESRVILEVSLADYALLFLSANQSKAIRYFCMKSPFEHVVKNSKHD
jgi:hypothetical protein